MHAKTSHIRPIPSLNLSMPNSSSLTTQISSPRKCPSSPFVDLIKSMFSLLAKLIPPKWRNYWPQNLSKCFCTTVTNMSKMALKLHSQSAKLNSLSKTSSARSAASLNSGRMCSLWRKKSSTQQTNLISTQLLVATTRQLINSHPTCSTWHTLC